MKFEVLKYWNDGVREYWNTGILEEWNDESTPKSNIFATKAQRHQGTQKLSH